METLNHIKIDLGTKGIVVGCEHNGRLVERTASMAEVSSMLTDLATVESGLLPPNTRFCKIEERSAIVAVQVAATKWNISIKHDAYDLRKERMEIIGVPLPDAIFIFHLSRYDSRAPFKISMGYVYALASSNLNKDEPLFLYPAPNVQREQTICWGFDQHAANAHSYKSLAGLEGAVALFFGAAFNDHCFEKNRLGAKFDWTKIKNHRAVEEYFEWLKLCGSFNPAWLAPANLTFGQVIKSGV